MYIHTTSMNIRDFTTLYILVQIYVYQKIVRIDRQRQGEV